METRRKTGILLLVLYGILIGAMLVLTLAGARLYAGAVESREASARQRSALSYLQTQAAACGGAGRVYLSRGPEGTAVCLRDTEEYVTRVYLYQGSLRTEYAREDRPMEPEQADSLCAADSFTAYWETEELLCVEADGRCAYIWCAGGGGNAAGN